MQRSIDADPVDRFAVDLPNILQFMQLLWAVAHGLEKTSKRMATDVGVTGPQRLVLRVVGLYPDMSAGELAAVLHLHASTLTGILQRLTVNRLLRRVPDPRDRRRAMLRLTARGRRVNAMTRGTIESAVAKALQGASGRDRAATRRVLERLAGQLETAVSAGSPSSRRRAASRRRAR